MSPDTLSEVEPVRLLFELTRDDNPRLYDDLMRFNKGTKRVNRLRFLAHEGLFAQSWATPPGFSGLLGAERRAGVSAADLSAARQTNQAFDTPPLPE